MGYPDEPFVHDTLGHWVIKKGILDHLGSSRSVEYMCVLGIPKTLV